jgi:hypothetical protein
MITIGRHSLPRAEFAQDVVADFPAQDQDYLRLLGEVTVLRQKRTCVGIAVIRGGIDGKVCREVQRTIGKLADYLSYARCGDGVVVAFQRRLFEQLKPIWGELLARSPGIRAGVAFPDERMSTRDSIMAARLALRRAVTLQCDLVALDERESLEEVARCRRPEPGSAAVAAHRSCGAAMSLQ